MKQSALLLSVCATAMLVATPAHAEEVPPEVTAELQELRARVSTLEALVQQLTGNQAEVAQQAADASATAQAAQVSFGAAARARSSSGWSFQPFGRLQYDVAHVDGPAGYTDARLGFGSELRRGRIGVQGDIPGGFGYKFELDFADNDVAITDAIITYDAGGGFEITAGQHNNFQSIEELTSSRFTSFMERAAFTDAFGFERRVGLSVGYAAGDVRFNAGAFTDDIDALTDSSDSAYSVDARLVYSPEIGGAQLHFGGSAHWRDLQSTGNDIRYRQRPAVHTTDTRFISTPNLIVEKETSFGLETAVISGRFHAVAEGHWLTADVLGADNPTFFGGYAEAGFFLTPGDSRGYSGGRFNRTRPARPVDEGGIGAVQLNARYDYLDLTDAGIVGGEQTLYGLSLIWTPIDHARLSINYSHIGYDDAAIAAGLDRDYSVNVIGARGELDF
jgi:phosphate-selective porin OprO/OprP